MPQFEDGMPTDYVDSSIIRQEFNKRKIVERAVSGDLYSKVVKSSHRIPPPPGEPVCTYSQMVFYYTLRGEFIGNAHQYLRPDGSIGASGRPDPKRLVIDGRILSVRTQKKK